MGEGWHNNHHAYQSSVRQGFRWWEIDFTFYMLKVLSFAGVVWDLKTPPAAVLRNEHRLGSRVIDRAASTLAESFNADHIAGSIRRRWRAPSLTALQERLRRRSFAPPTCWPACMCRICRHATRFSPRAMTMFANTPSIDDIVDRAHALLIEAVGTRLTAAPALAGVKA